MVYMRNGKVIQGERALGKVCKVYQVYQVYQVRARTFEHRLDGLDGLTRILKK